MKILGFSHTKIQATRSEKWDRETSIKIDVQFTDIAKETVSVLKQSDIAKVKFSYKINYEKNAEILFEGTILLDLGEEDLKELLKEWKKKEIPDKVKIPLLNIVMTRCNVKALELEEQLNLPFHLKFPKATGVKQA